MALVKNTVCVICLSLGLAATPVQADTNFTTQQYVTEFEQTQPTTQPLQSQTVPASKKDLKKELNKEAKKQPLEPGYKIVFHKTSKKKPQIENKKVRGQLYKYNNPYKRFEMKTDEFGQIHFKKDHGKNLAVSLYYIEGEEKLKVRCQGNALPGKKEIMVQCR